MNICFSIGDNSTIAINTLKKSADNLDFFTYRSIKDIINESLLRHISFDRIVFSSEIIDKSNPEGDLNSLNEFIKNYSNQTELVLILKKKSKSDDGLDKIFSKIFNSPMYTPVIMDRANPQKLLEIVRDDITELKTRYYILADSTDRVVVSGGEKDKNPKESSPQGTVPEKKKGVLGRLFPGSSKRKPGLEEVSQEPEEHLENPASTESIEINTVRDNVPEQRLDFNGYSGENGPISYTSGSNTEKGNPVFINGSAVNGSENNDVRFPEIDDDGDSLAIGDLGMQHADTGFLDEEEEEEILRELGSGGYVEENIVEEEEEVVKVKEEHKETHIDVVISTSGSIATKLIVDEAVKMSKDGMNVLIVDLDVKSNRLLSYIDVERFYREGANDGISKLRIYEEDGVGVASNGYGVPVTTRVLFNFLNSRVVKNYDMIFIDCPTDSLNIFNYNLISNCSVLIVCGNDRSDLITTSLELTNRDNVCYDVERYIMDNCMVEITGGKCSREDVNWLKRVCLFANGNWLLNID